jgi:phosphatidate cytidylyltransferase
MEPVLKKRILTASILIPLALFGLFYPPPWIFFLITTFITFAAAWEWSGLMGLKKTASRWLYLIFFILLCSALMQVSITFILISGFVWWWIALLLIILYPRGSGTWGQSRICRGVMGVLTLVPCWAAMNYIRDQPAGIYALLFLFALIWGADSAAYFVGKKWGKTKLAPQVSPGKSIQGVAGALVMGLLIGFIAIWLTEAPLSIWFWCLFISLMIVVFSIVGDLLESMLKRQAGVKDSGRLLPGHGGLLDRIDSLTAAAPIYAVSMIFQGM